MYTVQLDCARLNNLLAAAIDHGPAALPDSDAVLLYAHLQRCPACHETLAVGRALHLDDQSLLVSAPPRPER